MADLAKLSAGYAHLKKSINWSGTGKCKGYAIANPGEASQIDAYVAALVSGQYPAPPVLATEEGQGLTLILDGGYGRVAPPPTFTVTVTGTPMSGKTLTAAVA